jgi:hypothetical protein
MRNITMKKRLPVWVFLIFVLAGGNAVAQCTPETAGKMGPGPGMPDFAEFDLDGDGAIVSAEFYKARGERMAERAKAGGKMKHAANAPVFEDLDLDADGKISPEEFATHQSEEMANRRGKDG